MLRHIGIGAVRTKAHWTRQNTSRVVVLALVGPAVIAAWGQVVGAPAKPVISLANVDYVHNTLAISGMSFGANPKVSLAAFN